MGPIRPVYSDSVVGPIRPVYSDSVFIIQIARILLATDQVLFRQLLLLNTKRPLMRSRVLAASMDLIVSKKNIVA